MKTLTTHKTKQSELIQQQIDEYLASGKKIDVQVQDNENAKRELKKKLKID